MLNARLSCRVPEALAKYCDRSADLMAGANEEKVAAPLGIELRTWSKRLWGTEHVWAEPNGVRGWKKGRKEACEASRKEAGCRQRVNAM